MQVIEGAGHGFGGDDFDFAFSQSFDYISVR